MTSAIGTAKQSPRPARTLPRRAGKIRELAAQLAGKKLSEINARQAISDRVGYLVALVLGAAAMQFAGWRAVAGLGALYAFSAWRAWRRYRVNIKP